MIAPATVVTADPYDTHGEALQSLDLGGSNPRKSGRTGVGERDVPVGFGGITIRPGDRVTSDDGGTPATPGARRMIGRSVTSAAPTRLMSRSR
jgi:regulator of RNase E activity RraA